MFVSRKIEKKVVSRPRSAAQANSVRESNKQDCEHVRAGLSLRDITYNQTHASRAEEIAVIIRTSGEVKKQRSCTAGTAHSLPTVAQSICVQKRFTRHAKRVEKL